MNNLEIAIQQYLDSQNWHYKHDEEKRRFVLGMRLDNEDVDGCTLLITARDDEDLSCKAIYEFNVPEKKRAAIVEYITRANYGLFLGCFQMDLNDGEVLYQTAGVFYDHRPDQSEIRRIVQVGIHMAERYGQGFYDVMYKGVTPEAAIEAAESDVQQQASGSAPAPAPSRGASAPAPAGGDDDFASLVSEMSDNQLRSLASMIQQELQRRAAPPTPPSGGKKPSLADRFRRLVDGDR